MEEWQERTAMLLGEEGLGRLREARVVVVGTGGVGSAASEMLVRAGVGHIALVDSDIVSRSNINRQIVALSSTVGMMKVDVLKDRLLDISPGLDISTVPEFVTEDSVESLIGPLFGGRVDYVVDAIDTLSPKIALIRYCLGAGIPLVSSMGSGAKIDATMVRVADISKTFECPLARMIRKRLHKLGINTGFQAVFSPESPNKDGMTIEETRNKKSQVGTVSYIPAVFGCVCAQVVITSISRARAGFEQGAPPSEA